MFVPLVLKLFSGVMLNQSVIRIHTDSASTSIVYGEVGKGGFAGEVNWSIFNFVDFDLV